VVTVTALHGGAPFLARLVSVSETSFTAEVLHFNGTAGSLNPQLHWSAGVALS
jgi:hypothetical protein